MALFNWNKAKLEAQADEVARALGRFAEGDLSGTFHGGAALTSRLSPAIHNLQDKLVGQRSDATALGAALVEMKRAHAAGDIDAVIVADALPEPYRSIARNINDLVKSHIDVKMQVVNVVTRYADGDFSVEMERLPGKKAQITQAIDRAKISFQAVTAQAAESDKFIAALAEMTKQHELGWIDEQIPAADFNGGYRRAAELVNDLVRSHINVKMKVVEVITKYAHGDFSVTMDRLPGKKAQITEAMDQVRELLPKPEEIAAMKRVEAALEIVGTNVMIADADNVICYMNRAVTALMRNAERDLQKDLPNFRADRLLSSKIDQFHKNPSHQTRLLADLRATHTAEIVVGGRTMLLVVNPVINAMGNRIGAVVEWTDRTVEVALERETASVVDAAGRGDFTKRLAVDGRAGFFKVLAENINRLVQTCDVGLNEVVRVLGALAKGDLTEKITNEYEGTFGRLKDDSNATVDSLTRTVIDIKEAADTVSTSAREISAGNGDLSQRTEEQAASLEETAASMEQLTATVHQNTENAKQANELAIGASTIALKGGRVVGEVVETMAAINASAKKIVDIISVIDGIAFQTNILALNAAVEAARAGEQGRGFAVVAGEVRTLAQRSAAAAKEIKALIGDSVDKTTAGSKLVDEAGQTMAEIVASVKRVTDIMAAIANASVEQGSGIEQVNTAVTQMDQVTQQNSALVEQIAASAEGLEERAQMLVALVSVFTVADHGARAFGAAPQVAAATPVAAKSKRNPPAPAPQRAPARKAATPRPGDEADWSSF